MNKNHLLITALILLIRLIPGANAQSYTISTIAGNGIAAYSGDGGPATAAEINYPGGSFADGSGNIYISDSHNQRVRKVDASGIITLIAGNGIAGNGGIGGPATAASFDYPYQLAVDKSGNLFISDWSNHAVKMVNTSGIISIAAGKAGFGGFYGDGGPATDAELNSPSGIAFDNNGNAFICDNNNNRVRMVNTYGIISTIGGDGYNSGFGYPGRGGYTGDGGAATAAEFHWPSNIAADIAGNVLISDQMNHSIRMINTIGIMSTVAGNGVSGFYGDGGPATAAEFNNTCGVGTDPSGNIIIADMYNNRIRLVNTLGIITTIAGNGIGSFSGDGGPATSAELNSPLQLSVDASGNIYFCDAANNRVRKLTPDHTEGINKLTTTGIDVRVFPNPNNGVFTISLNHPLDIAGSQTIIEIYNILGKQVYSQQILHSSSFIVDLKQPNGLYLYRLLDETGNVISDGKLIIQK